jgi:LPS export ABC transporter protein LptC
MWIQPRRLGIAIIMVVVGYILLNATQSGSSLSNDTPSTTKPLLLFAENIETQTFSSNGQLTNSMSGKRLEQHSQNLIQITSPKVRFLNEDNSQWQVSAQSGVYKNDSLLQLLNDVHAERSDPKHIQINTDSLLLNTKTNFISTKDPVTFLSQDGKLTAIGMTFDTKTENIEFLADVQALYTGNKNE